MESVFTEEALIQLTRNDFEPDICFFKQEKSKQFEEDQPYFPALDLVVEMLSQIMQLVGSLFSG